MKKISDHSHSVKVLALAVHLGRQCEGVALEQVLCALSFTLASGLAHLPKDEWPTVLHDDIVPFIESVVEKIDPDQLEKMLRRQKPTAQ